MGNNDDSRALHELGRALRRWADDDTDASAVRVLDRHGFGTVPPGQLLVGTAAGARAGSLLGGTMDRVAVPLLAQTVSQAATTDGHVAEPDALAAGLACSGGAQLLGHPLPAALAAELGAALERGMPATLLSTVDGANVLVAAGPGLTEVTGTLGTTDVDDAALQHARGLARRGATATERIESSGVTVLLDVWVAIPTLLVVGAGAIADALAAQAEVLGWPVTTVTELRAARGAAQRFTASDVLVLLDHSPAFDEVLLELLRSDVGFVGALGSRRTQAARRERLLAAGLSEAELARLHGPVGLDLGAATPAETAVSVVAEVIAVRAGRAATPLRGTQGRIGG